MVKGILPCFPEMNAAIENLHQTSDFLRYALASKDTGSKVEGKAGEVDSLQVATNPELIRKSGGIKEQYI